MNIKDVFSKRLKSARLLNGFSLQVLANEIGGVVSRQALHRYEKAEVLPNSDIIDSLSKALKVSSDYFFNTSKVELDNIEFRKVKNVSQRAIDIIKEKVREYLTRYLELEEIIGNYSKFINPLQELDEINTYDQVHAAARILREKWRLGIAPVYNIVELLEDKNIKVVELEVEDGFDGLQTMLNNKIPVIAYNKKKNFNSCRIRFTLLHELGHLLLKFGKISNHEKETLCHQFAGAVLLPEEAVLFELGNHRNKLSILELGAIKRQYGISMQAIIMRAKVVGIISEYYTRQLFIMIKHRNWSIDEPIDYEGIEKSDRFVQLLFRALIEEQISLSKAAALSNMSLAEFRKTYQFLL